MTPAMNASPVMTVWDCEVGRQALTSSMTFSGCTSIASRPFRSHVLTCKATIGDPTTRRQGPQLTPKSIVQWSGHSRWGISCPARCCAGCLVSKKRLVAEDMMSVRQAGKLDHLRTPTKSTWSYVVTVRQCNRSSLHPTKMRPPIIKGDENMSPGRSMDANPWTNSSYLTPSPACSCLASALILMTWTLPELVQTQAYLSDCPDASDVNISSTKADAVIGSPTLYTQRRAPEVCNKL